MLNSISSVNPSGFFTACPLSFVMVAVRSPSWRRKRAGAYSSRPLSRFLGQLHKSQVSSCRTNYQVRRLLLGMGFPAGIPGRQDFNKRST